MFCFKTHLNHECHWCDRRLYSCWRICLLKQHPKVGFFCIIDFTTFQLAIWIKKNTPKQCSDWPQLITKPFNGVDLNLLFVLLWYLKGEVYVQKTSNCSMILELAFMIDQNDPKLHHHYQKFNLFLFYIYSNNATQFFWEERMEKKLQRF